MSFASTLRQSQFSLLQYLFQDLNQALCFCLRHIITSPFKFTIQRYFCPYFQYPHPGILRKFTREGAAVSSRYSPRIRSPLGVTPERGGRGAAAVPESSGRRRTGGGVPRRARRGRFSPGRRGQNGCTQRGLCRVSGHLCDRGGSAGEKARFCLIRKRYFPVRGSCQIRAVLRPNSCRFGRVAFSAARSDECVTPGGAGEKPRRKTKRPSERSAPHEKPDFRYRD